MESLSTEEIGELKKLSTERLKIKLVKYGMDEESVAAMDRAALIEAAAEIKHPAALGTAVTKPMEIWQRELALREQEIELRKIEAAEKAAQREEEAARRRRI